MATPRAYRSYDEFEREEIRPGMRIGWSVDELDEPNPHAELDFDFDPYEAALDAAENEEDEDE